MRYILDDNGYIHSVSCNMFECNDKSCTEYTGTIPDGYETLDEWVLNANIRAYKIVDNNLVYDEAKDAELQAEWEISSETILYKDNDGTTGSVFLDKSKTKFSKLKITAKSNTDTWQTIEIPTNVEQFRISIIDNNSSGTDAWIKQNTYILNDDEITFQSGFWRNINGNVSGQESAITIYEVIGYK